MNFNFLSVPTFEEWDWTNPDTKGIGGSETSHIEMSNRLASRGHLVRSYAPCDLDEPTANPHGVIWQRCDKDPDIWKRPGIWVIYRDPEMIGPWIKPDVPVWLICQDVDYRWTDEALKRVDRIVALCQTHGQYLRVRYPDHADKVFVSSNGIKPELVKAVFSDPPVRNPRRLIYASSPDRGLWYLIDVFVKAREIVRDLELHVYYGFDNIEKWLGDNPDDNQTYFGVKRRELKAKIASPGIIWHGRTAQPDLAREWATAGIWCHPSMFTETSCITCMDAQAFGAIPITTPIWAIAENVRHGIFIDGDSQRAPLTQARFVHELVSLAANPARQEEIRSDMMPWAREFFNWENFVTQWENWAHKDLRAKAKPFVVPTKPALEEATV